MGAWIEIQELTAYWEELTGRTPRWVRGLKFLKQPTKFISWTRRTPRWVRGLKLKKMKEISYIKEVAPHDGCVDWNTGKTIHDDRTDESHPTMGAWIEIEDRPCKCWNYCVAPHDGCVDWNLLVLIALIRCLSRTPRWVRGLKSVRSVSVFFQRRRTPRWVRGLKWVVSLSHNIFMKVAPHDGCVDWNNYIKVKLLRRSRRTPRWVRGLKYRTICGMHLVYPVVPHDGCVDWNFIA